MRNSFTFVLCALAPLYAGRKIDPRLSETLARFPNTQTLVWVFFTDKGSHEILKASVPASVVSQRSIRRRLKIRSLSDAVDYTDIPVDQRYVERIASSGARVRNVSKWFNGVSVSATKRQIEEFEGLPFVARIELLARFRRNNSEETVNHRVPIPKYQPSSGLLSFDYGPSSAQLNQINVPAVHNTGNYGQGVLVGVFDNGFRLLNHEAFDTLRTRIVATYDFVDKKVSVAPSNPDPGFGAHGIITLSALGGFKPGQLIGPAFGASFILARTENDSSETPFEEDNWVAAIEWADSIGVDVTSTSLGYLNYDTSYASWTWDQMNGNTTVITRAADMAVSKGIVVVNSAGNNGLNTTRNTLNAPADGDSVLSIGAVTIDGTRANFSSVGPTTSVPPRIKPDLMAQGITVRCARWDNPTQYTYSQGTSLSCPLAAGVVALLLRAKPNATPMQIANALKQTANRASSPDNLYGWGIINALDAILSIGGYLQNASTYSFYRSPGGLTYALPQPSRVTLRVYSILGQEVKTLINGDQPQGIQSVDWNGTNSSGNFVASGVYFFRFVAQGLTTNVSYRHAIKLVFVR
jgi:hypothetical protein